MTNEAKSSTPAPHTEVNSIGKEALSQPDFARLVRAVGKNSHLFYLLDMARNPNIPYGIEARPLAPIINRNFQQVNSDCFRPSGLTTDVHVGTQHYYMNCEDRELAIFAPKLSDKGKKFGVPVAGLMAEFALRQGIALERVFQEGVSDFWFAMDNATLRRLDQLKEIMEMKGEFRCKDFHELLKQDRDVWKPIAERKTTADELSRLGWVDFSLKVDKSGFISSFSYKPTKKGVAALNELMTTLEGVRTQDPEVIDKGKAFASEIISDQNRHRALLFA